ncbi:MAG TPA: DinB family protein [Chloroflexota bacterium]|jgi:uncharacterized damage-inducible protein DinB|nr:DinB family protein [Chloroflexota bacterium]
MIEAPERIDPPKIASERDMLEAWLEFHRATLATKCAGLSDQQMRDRAVPPSPLSFLGLLRHMTEVERGWFAWTLDGVDVEPIYYSEEQPDLDFDDIDTQDPAEAFAVWQDQCDVSRRAAAGFESLDDVGKRTRGEDGEPKTVYSLRWIMVHVIEEYARHNGHADFLRERIDGQTGE